MINLLILLKKNYIKPEIDAPNKVPKALAVIKVIKMVYDNF